MNVSSEQEIRKPAVQEDREGSEAGSSKLPSPRIKLENQSIDLFSASVSNNLMPCVSTDNACSQSLAECAEADSDGNKITSNVGFQCAKIPATVPLTLDQASNARYPPGCFVLHVDAATTPPSIVAGIVESVAIGLDLHNEFVYGIVPQDLPHEPVFARASQIQWAPSCPVFARPVHLAGDHPAIPAIVLGSYQSLAGAIVYSIQDAGDPSSIFHGIPEHGIISYRSETSTPSKASATLYTPAIPASVTESRDSSTTHRSQSSSPMSVASPLAKRRRICPAKTTSARPFSLTMVQANRMNGSTDAARSAPSSSSSKHLAGSVPSAVDSTSTGRCRTQGRNGMRRLSLPRMLETETIRDALIDEPAHQLLQRSSMCKISVRGHPFDRGSVEKGSVHVILTGSESYLDAAVEAVENALVKATAKAEHGRVLYHLAKSNKTSEASEGRASLQRSPSDLKSKVWMCVYYIPENKLPFMGVFVGKRAARLKELALECRCRVTSMKESVRPHLFIEGESAADVNGAYALIAERLRRVQAARS